MIRFLSGFFCYNEYAFLRETVSAISRLHSIENFWSYVDLLDKPGARAKLETALARYVDGFDQAYQDSLSAAFVRLQNEFAEGSKSRVSEWTCEGNGMKKHKTGYYYYPEHFYFNPASGEIRWSGYIHSTNGPTKHNATKSGDGCWLTKDQKVIVKELCECYLTDQPCGYDLIQEKLGSSSDSSAMANKFRSRPGFCGEQLLIHKKNGDPNGTLRLFPIAHNAIHKIEI